jgi:hypothetical protein
VREIDGEAGAVIVRDAAFEGEMATEGLDAFAHAAQAVAFAHHFVSPVVFHDHAAMAGFEDEAEAAVGGVCVADDVGDGLAQCESQGSLLVGAEGLASGLFSARSLTPAASRV